MPSRQRESKEKQGSRAASCPWKLPPCQAQTPPSPHIPQNTTGIATALHPPLRSSRAEMCHSRRGILVVPTSFRTWLHTPVLGERCYPHDHTIVWDFYLQGKTVRRGSPLPSDMRFMDFKLLADICSHLIQLLSSLKSRKLCQIFNHICRNTDLISACIQLSASSNFFFHINLS